MEGNDGGLVEVLNCFEEDGSTYMLDDAFVRDPSGTLAGVDDLSEEEGWTYLPCLVYVHSICWELYSRMNIFAAFDRVEKLDRLGYNN